MTCFDFLTMVAFPQKKIIYFSEIMLIEEKTQLKQSLCFFLIKSNTKITFFSFAATTNPKTSIKYMVFTTNANDAITSEFGNHFVKFSTTSLSLLS